MRSEVFVLRIASEFKLPNRWLWHLIFLLLGASAFAQTCTMAADMDAPARAALESAGKRYFQMAAQGDTASLKQNSIAAVAAGFAGIEASVKDNQAAFAGAQGTVRPSFLLTAEGTVPLARAEFLCGVFGSSGQTKNSTVFVLPNLPPGKYSLVILDVSGGSAAMTLTLVLQQIGNDWKLAGFFPRASQVAGHDAEWFLQRAAAFKTKSENHNAWLYYREAIALSSPVDFMSTLATDKLYDETHLAQPTDVPVNGSSLDIAAAGKTYHLTEIFPLAVGADLDVVVKYQTADVSDTARAFQENMAVIKAVVAKFPELREAFAGVVARAVEPSGRDYGSLLPMKDVK
jgi:hypothetical protein